MPSRPLLRVNGGPQGLARPAPVRATWPCLSGRRPSQPCCGTPMPAADTCLRRLTCGLVQVPLRKPLPQGWACSRPFGPALWLALFFAPRLPLGSAESPNQQAGAPSLRCWSATKRWALRSTGPCACGALGRGQNRPTNRRYNPCADGDGSLCHRGTGLGKGQRPPRARSRGRLPTSLDHWWTAKSCDEIAALSR
jgi:hypothetical protein